MKLSKSLTPWKMCRQSILLTSNFKDKVETRLMKIGRKYIENKISKMEEIKKEMQIKALPITIKCPTFHHSPSNQKMNDNLESLKSNIKFYTQNMFRNEFRNNIKFLNKILSPSIEELNESALKGINNGKKESRASYNVAKSSNITFSQSCLTNKDSFFKYKNLMNDFMKAKINYGNLIDKDVEESKSKEGIKYKCRKSKIEKFYMKIN